MTGLIVVAATLLIFAAAFFIDALRSAGRRLDEGLRRLDETKNGDQL